MAIVVTIGICVRDCEKSIKTVLESVANQDFPSNQMEVIFVDDGSRDGTLERIEHFAPIIRAKTNIYHQEWRGIGVARNLVLKKALGKYVIWIDGDMELPVDHVRKQVEQMELNPKVGVSKARYGYVNSEKTVVVLENSRAFDLQQDGERLFGTGGSIYRLEAIREVGGFDENIRGAGEDVDALARIIGRGWLVSTSNTEFYEHYKDTWRSLWRQYYWWGCGAHYFWHKHRGLISLATRLPPSAFAIGTLKFLKVYRHHRNKVYLLLPLHSIFKETAWFFGFIHGHVNRYGH